LSTLRRNRRQAKIRRKRSGPRRESAKVAEMQFDFNAELTSPTVGSAPVTFLSHLAPARMTEVYESYWRFAAERQNIFFKRLERSNEPWTRDPILSQYKFTNAYRASDRVSQYLIRHVIYRDDLPMTEREVCFRILLFKFFNKIETWRLLESRIGPILQSEYHFERYDEVLKSAMESGHRIYSAAYIMPPGQSAFGKSAKHQNNLLLLEMMMESGLPERLTEARTMQEGFHLLRAYPTIGDFLAYQFITDINYSNVTDFSEMEFVVPGPGAKDGLRKCFADAGGLNEAELIRLMSDIQEREFERLGIEFRSLWGRPLQLIDCQNLFCEVDKYSRVAHPHIKGKTGRTRIKQKFAPTSEHIEFWYPPKWKLNDQIRHPSFREHAH
jgi:alpha-glutamyl/putrescinyl thymine pyrophosphorylase clade 1